MPSLISRLIKELKQGKFDIIHAHGAFPGVWGTISGIAAKTPHIIVHCQNTYYDADVQYKIKMFFLKKYVERFIAASYAVKESIVRCVRIDPKKIVIIYNSAARPPTMDAEEKKASRLVLGIDPYDFVVGSISRLETHKGHRYLIDAVESLRPAIPKLKCLIVGDGDALRALRMATRNKGLEGIVNFTGWQKDINKFLSVMDVFVQPSTLREGLPLALAEAASAGIALIATDIGGNAEIVREGANGFIIHPKNAQELAEKIKYLYEYPDARNTYGKNSIKIWEQNFTLDTMLHKIDSLYQSVYHRTSQ